MASTVVGVIDDRGVKSRREMFLQVLEFSNAKAHLIVYRDMIYKENYERKRRWSRRFKSAFFVARQF